MGNTKKYTLLKAIFLYSLRNFVKLLYIHIYMYTYIYIHMYNLHVRFGDIMYIPPFRS